MRTFAFITRHEITPEQIEICRDHDITPIPVGDMNFNAVGQDDFSDYYREVLEERKFDPVIFDGVITVNAQIALEMFQSGYPVGLFTNSMRAKEGEKPTFLATALRVYE